MELMATLQLMNHTASKHGSQVPSQELKFYSSLIHLMRYWSKKHQKLIVSYNTYLIEAYTMNNVTQMLTGNSEKFTVMLIIII